ncbi:MAG TPA: BamA/TamA family outer membrane protein [Vicinamibacterales bacterium]|nr:BamA/TamA family outer membrane protein [Vicinamibacterales bacterium]
MTRTPASARSSRWRPLALVTCILAALPGVSACDEREGIRVAALRFEGNDAFDDGQLASVLATRRSGILPWSEPRVFSRTAFEADLKRLVAFYDDRGYPDARVRAADVEFTDDGAAVRLTIHLDEGEPVRIERVVLLGMPDDVPLDVARLPIRAGETRDRRTLLATTERVTFVLRDRGYPDARVESRAEPGASDRSLVLTIEATPGAAGRFGDVSIVNLESVEPAVVLRTLAFEPGDVYRESQLLESQRRLFALGLFDFAHVARTQEAAPDDSGLPMTVTVKEGRPTRFQMGVGYGTESGPRGSIEWQHRNFGGNARQLGLDGRYSARLSGLGARVGQPYLGGRPIAAGVEAGAYWQSEPTFSSRRIGVRTNLTRSAQIARGLDLAPIDRTARVTYTNESLEYTIDPDALGAVTNVDELIALGLDPTSGSGRGRLGSLSADIEQAVIDRPIDPRSGYAVSAHFEHAAPWLGGTFEYQEVLVNGRVYLPVGRSVVWASRLRAGVLVSPNDELVPFSARYFLGGSTSLRGWGRYEVSPLSGDGLPLGGRSVLEISSELRMPIAGQVGAVFFVDAGNAWVDESLRPGDLRVAAGPGIRWLTAFGAIRADVGVQVNPIPGLRIDGEPQRRRWRIHLSFGHAF